MFDCLFIDSITSVRWLPQNKLKKMISLQKRKVELEKILGIFELRIMSDFGRQHINVAIGNNFTEMIIIRRRIDGISRTIDEIQWSLVVLQSAQPSRLISEALVNVRKNLARHTMSFMGSNDTPHIMELGWCWLIIRTEDTAQRLSEKDFVAPLCKNSSN